ncbi:MAG: enolase [Candidatus Latescibacteria bacterium]|nr:enolase [Candidatus Latescibacterota bacterium]
MKIVKAECITLDIPFYAQRVTRAMQRASTHGERVGVFRLELEDGTVGYGDNHGGGGPVDHLVGQNALALAYQDSVGYGPQLALFDAIGKAAGVPVYQLLGTKVRDRCPVSWWDIDMPAQDWAAEARESIKRGYTCIKLKARPWRDIIHQVEIVSKAVPRDYKFDIDFNGFLLTPAKAEIILAQLDERDNVGMYESPFYLHRNLDDARLIRERARKPVIEHFQEQYLAAHCADGFVIGGGFQSTRRSGELAAAFNKPFWLQLVGTGITTAWAVHLGATLTHAQLPYITCHELWKHSLLKKRLDVVDGYIAVSDAPGLGIEVDEKALAKYQVDPDSPTPKDRYQQKKRILQINWPGPGKHRRVWEFTNEARYQQEFYQGNIPGFERGVTLDVIENDNSAAFKKTHAKLVTQGR